MNYQIHNQRRAVGETDRGREASRQGELPPRGWWDVLLRVGDDLNRHNVSLVAGGLAMYALLAVFPGLTALVFITGIFISPDHLVQQLQAFASAMPPGVWDLFKAQLHAAAGRTPGTVTAAAAVSLAVAILSARSGMSSLMSATNIAYGEDEKRSFIVQVALSLLFTVGALFAFIIMLVLAVAVPLVLRFIGLSAWMQSAAAVVRWFLLWCFAVGALALVYRFAPSREQARWKWLTAGSISAATLWLAGTVLFGVYVEKFGGYQQSYGALSSVVVLLMWFLLSSFAVMLGAELNAESERQTRRDSTTGAPQPMGHRGAFAADTLGRTAPERRAHGPDQRDRQR